MAKHRLTKKLIKALNERDTENDNSYRNVAVYEYEELQEKCILCCYLESTEDPTWVEGTVSYALLMDNGANWYCEDCQVALGYRW